MYFATIVVGLGGIFIGLVLRSRLRGYTFVRSPSSIGSFLSDVQRTALAGQRQKALETLLTFKSESGELRGFAPIVEPLTGRVSFEPRKSRGVLVYGHSTPVAAAQFEELAGFLIDELSSCPYHSPTALIGVVDLALRDRLADYIPSRTHDELYKATLKAAV